MKIKIDQSRKRKRHERRVTNKRPSSGVARREILNSLHISKKEHPSKAGFVCRENSGVEANNNRRMATESKTTID